MESEVELFNRHFRSLFLELAKDKVSNVRYTLTKVIRDHINTKGIFLIYY